MKEYIPQHYMLKLKKGFNEMLFASLAQERFKVEKIIVDIQMGDITETIKRQISTLRKLYMFAVYMGKDYFYRLTLIDNDEGRKLFDEEICDCDFESFVINKLILEEIFNIKEDSYAENVEHTDDISAGMAEVKSGEYQCMICVNTVKKEIY